jgi:AraC-like DNA-binding protein
VHCHVSPQQQVIEAIVDRIRKDPGTHWRVPRLAAAAGFCETRLRREFKSATGVSPARFILRTRLHAAVPMIEQGVYTLEGIAEQLGFSSAFHLSTAFKKAYGVSPSKWQ